MNNISTNKKSYFLSLVSYVLFLILNSQFFILNSCEANDPPPPGNGGEKKEQKITLSVDDTSPTEVWLEVATENISLPDTVTLLRNNVTVKTIELTDSNYVVYRDSLLPSQSYTYRVTKETVTSNEALAVTMDTTSHNFTYEVFEFGEHGNSVLRDVAIIDENNIWAVGAVYLNDSTGQPDNKLYNAVHWNGNEWEFMKLQFFTFCEQPFTNSYPARSVLAFSSNEILITSGSQITFHNGVSQVNTECIPVSVNRMWGTGINNVYAVGSVGKIAHYNGSSWSKLESGTEMTLTDVYGTTGNKVYASGVEVFESGIVLKGNPSGFSVYKESGYVNESELFETLYGELGSVWIDEKGTLYTAGSYLYWQRRGDWSFVESLSENYYQANIGATARGYIVGITGNGSNDYVISGGRNTIKHFNGKSWQQIGMEYSPSSPIIWRGSEQKGDLIIGVGEINNKAIIIKLKR